MRGKNDHEITFALKHLTDPKSSLCRALPKAKTRPEQIVNNPGMSLIWVKTIELGYINPC